MTPVSTSCSHLVREAVSAVDIAPAVQPTQEWDVLALRLDEVLHRTQACGSWLEPLAEVHTRARALASRHLDQVLLHGFHGGPAPVGCYRSRQALLRMLVAGEVARALGYGPSLLEHLDRAALALELPPTLLQERLTRLIAPVSGEPVHALVQRWAADAQALLLDGSDAEPLWMQAVRQRNDLGLTALPPWLLTTAQHLVLLLRRVDQYCARITRHAGSAPLTAVLAADARCLGRDARPDLVGAALLRAMGLYPPGSCVQLDSGEHGIVLARGRHPGQPLLALLSDALGAALPTPRLCDPAQSGLGVRALLRVDQLPVQPSLEQVHALCATLKDASPD